MSTNLSEEFEMNLCLPSVTEDLKQSILEQFVKIKQNYDSNNSYSKYDEFRYNNLTIKNIIEELLKYYMMNKPFEIDESYYERILRDYIDYFNAVQRDTINHMNNTEKSQLQEELFNLLRFKFSTLIQLTLDSIIIWYKRTNLWNTKYSKKLH